MRRVTAIVCAVVVLLTAGAWAVAAAGSSHGMQEPATSQGAGTIRASRSYGHGPSAEYDFDSGTIGGVAPLRMTLPSGATYDVVVSISLDYRTSPDDRFIVGLSTRRDSKYGPRVPVAPPSRPILASRVRTSTTALFRLSDVPGGHEYWFSPGVNLSERVGNRASIASDHLVLVVDATPSR